MLKISPYATHSCYLAILKDKTMCCFGVLQNITLLVETCGGSTPSAVAHQPSRGCQMHRAGFPQGLPSLFGSELSVLGVQLSEKTWTQDLESKAMRAANPAENLALAEMSGVLMFKIWP